MSENQSTKPASESTPTKETESTETVSGQNDQTENKENLTETEASNNPANSGEISRLSRDQSKDETLINEGKTSPIELLNLLGLGRF